VPTEWGKWGVERKRGFVSELCSVNLSHLKQKNNQAQDLKTFLSFVGHINMYWSNTEFGRRRHIIFLIKDTKDYILIIRIPEMVNNP